MAGYDGYIEMKTDGTVLTIEGHGATFDAAGKGSFFHVGNKNTKVSLTVRSVTMKNGFAYAGGAVIVSHGDATFDACRFINNNGGNGGAVYVDSSNVRLDASRFINNNGGNGGAVYVESGNVALEACTLVNNTSSNYGGALDFDGGTGLIQGCSFVGPISEYHNDIFRNDDTINVTFACVDRGGGTPVQMQDYEITVIPPKELQCTKPTPSPPPSPPPTPSPTPLRTKVAEVAAVLAVILLLLASPLGPAGAASPLGLLYRRRGCRNNTAAEQAEDAEVPLLATGVDKVVRAYNEAVLGGTQTVTWAKLMFIGQGRAGKTSLLRNLTNQGFQADECITDGADVCIVSNGMWGKTEEMARGNFDRGVAEVVGGKVAEEADGGQRPWYSRRCLLVGAVCALALVGGLVVGLDPQLLHRSPPPSILPTAPPTPAPASEIVEWSGLEAAVKAAAGKTATLTLTPSFTMAGYDGYIYLHTDGTVLTIEGHGATFDAAGKGSFFHVGYENTKVSLTVRNVTMKNGFASSGGAVLVSHGDATFDACRFINNTGIYGGAVYVDSSNVRLDASRFINNTGLSGGAVYVDSGNVALEACTLVNNTAVLLTGGSAGGDGGALYFYAYGGNGTGLIQGCSFVGPISEYHNDIANQNGGENITFVCADGEVGTPVQMQGKEITVIPPKELKCTKPPPPPLPSIPSSLSATKPSPADASTTLTAHSLTPHPRPSYSRADALSESRFVAQHPARVSWGRAHPRPCNAVRVGWWIHRAAVQEEHAREEAQSSSTRCD
jgi:hypothetical protein